MTLAQSRTEYFYQWEERGRGWICADRPIALEPPYTPFNPPTVIEKKKRIDDGKHLNLVQWGWKKLTEALAKEENTELPALALVAVATGPLTILTISLSPSLDLSGFEAEQLLLMLSYCKYPVSFELIGLKEKVEIQFACQEADTPYVVSQFKTFYPTCTILQSKDALAYLRTSGMDTLMADLALKEEFMRPLAFFDRKAPSPYLGLSGIFGILQSEECACVQVLFQGATKPWPGSIMRSVTDTYGDSFFMDAPEMPKLAEYKISSQLFGVAVRVFASSRNSRRTDEIMGHLTHAVISQTASQYNSLDALSAEGYSGSDHFNDIMNRQSRRLGMLLNTEELALMVHVPGDALLIQKLIGENAKTKVVPGAFVGHRHVLGLNVHQGLERPVSIGDERFTHMHVIGATGTGKSTFLLNNIVQDIQNGNGLAVFDPHGDLIESVLSFIPRHRLKDVIIVDPSDTEYSVGFNMLSAHTELEKEVLSSDLVSVFQKLSTSWGDQMSSVLANAILAFVENTESGTLPDVRRFLIEPSFREKILKTVTDSSIRYYWQKEFPILKTNSIGSILTRLDAFLRPKSIRFMLGQKKGLNFDDILNSRKILLVKLSHGLIGESNSYLLGSLLVSKIYQTALARQNEQTSDRKDFFVYIDEFQHFITPSLSRILSGGRKYRLGLVLAHQSLEQISKTDSELADSLISNAGARVCFRLGESDAQKLEKGFSFFDETDLLNLGTGEAICRIGRSDADFNLRIPKNMPVSGDMVSPREVIETSRKKYGVLRSEIETEIPVSENVPKEETLVQAKPKPIRKEPEIVEEKKPDPVEQEVEKKTAEPHVIEDPALVEELVKRKEESRHRYLQMLIKRNAESRGYKATIEQSTKDGKGRVDVVLQKGKTILAVEIGVTTTKDWEVHNIEKCLADGYVNIIALSEDMKGADLMTRKLTEFGIFPKQSDRVKVYDMTGFMGMLNAEDLDKGPKVKTIKGYRVKVKYADDAK